MSIKCDGIFSCSAQQLGSSSPFFGSGGCNIHTRQEQSEDEHQENEAISAAYVEKNEERVRVRH